MLERRSLLSLQTECLLDRSSKQLEVSGEKLHICCPGVLSAWSFDDSWLGPSFSIVEHDRARNQNNITGLESDQCTYSSAMSRRTHTLKTACRFPIQRCLSLPAAARVSRSRIAKIPSCEWCRVAPFSTSCTMIIWGYQNYTSLSGDQTRFDSLWPVTGSQLEPGMSIGVPHLHGAAILHHLLSHPLVAGRTGQ
jgi:hypothetical protein